MILNIKKKNVLGCFLGQDLVDVRAASNIVHRAVRSLLIEHHGKFTKMEDETILKFVNKRGANFGTWKLLGRKLDRDSAVVRNRFRDVLQTSGCTSGLWSLVDEEICLRKLFKDEHSDRDFIESISREDLQPVSDELGRSMHPVLKHWEGRLKPVLLSYHDQTLLTNVTPHFLSYIIERKLSATQEIMWDDVIKHFPTQTPKYLTRELSNKLTTINKCNPHEVNLPLYLKLQKNAFEWKNQEMSEKVKNYRLAIVSLYDAFRILPD